jgi:hypothetical protein
MTNDLNKSALENCETDEASYCDQLAELAERVSDGGNFTISALRLIHFVRCNAPWLESELLG